MRFIARLVLVLVVATPVAADRGVARTDDPDDPPVAVFAELDGTWRGTFVGYDQTGRELYRIAVTQTYRTLDATTQEVTIEDRFPDGRRVTGRGTNVARRGPDGELALTCTVRKSDGDEVRHRGRLVRGPDEAPALVWYSAAPGRVETFREVVHHEGAPTVYEINGMGRYGETLILMHGKYFKIGSDGATKRRNDGGAP